MSDIPASWQPDPRGRHEYRYWDGSKWTDHVSDQGQTSLDPVDVVEPEATSSVFSPGETPAAATPEPEPEPVAAEPDPEPEPEPVAAEPDPEPEPEPEPVAEAPAEPQPEPTTVTEPAPVAEPAATSSVFEPATPAASAAPPSAAPPGGTTAPATQQTDAKAAAQEVLHSKSPELATILSVIVPGSGHFYMGTDKVPLAAGLVAATVAAVVISHMSFLFFLIGFAVWVGAGIFALTDLRGGVRGIEDTSLPKNVVGILLIGAGAVLVVSLLLPWYRVSVDGFGSTSGNAFDVFDFEQIVWLVVGIGSVVAGAASLGLGPVTSAELPKWLPTAVAVGGAIAAVLVLFRMFVDSAPGALDGGGVVDVNIGRALGMWLALWASLVLVTCNLGVLRSMAKR